ncbi:MAG: hypothetical protein ACON3Z_19995 [Bradymonadia bacterium]
MLQPLYRRTRTTKTMSPSARLSFLPILFRRAYVRTVSYAALVSVCTLTCTACVATFSPPSELMSSAGQQSIHGRMGRGQADTLRQGDFSLRSIRTGLVAVSGKETAQVCEVGFEFSYVHGLQNTWIGTCRTSARLERGAVVAQALDCQLKPLAGKPFTIRLSGTQTALKGELGTSVSQYVIAAAEAAPAHVVLKSQGLAVLAADLSRPGRVWTSSELSREEAPVLSAVPLILALYYDRVSPRRICIGDG